MKRCLPFVSALVLGFFCLASLNTAYCQTTGNAAVPKELTKEEAAKYPPPKGQSYPEAVPLSTSTGGFYRSPFSSKVYDLRKINRHALILDDAVKKVFVRP